MSGLPWVPPPIKALSGSEDAAKAASEARIRDTAFAQGLEQGRREGHATGYSEGHSAGAAEARTEASAEIAARGRDGSAALADAIRSLMAHRAQDQQDLDAAARAAVAAALGHVLPILIERAAGQEIVALVARAVTEHQGQERLELRAHPDTLAQAQEEGLSGITACTIQPVPDPGLRKGAAMLRWAGGGAAYDPHDLADRIITALAPKTETTEPQDSEA